MLSSRSTSLISTVGDLDAPGLGGLVEDALQVDVELVALREQVIHLVLADHRAQRGLGDLAGGIEGVRDLDDRLARIDDAEIHHRVHLHRDVVARDHVLLGHVEHDDAQVDACACAARTGQTRIRPGPLMPVKRPRVNITAALVLVQHLDGAEDEHQRVDDDDGNPNGMRLLRPGRVHCGSTHNVSPSTLTMRAVLAGTQRARAARVPQLPAVAHPPAPGEVRRPPRRWHRSCPACRWPPGGAWRACRARRCRRSGAPPTLRWRRSAAGRRSGRARRYQTG